MANRPNILFIMSDDHASQAISSYSGRINQTPNIDRIAQEGARFDDCFCTNSICTPSRAVILTGKYSHLNGVKTLVDDFDGRQPHVAKMLQQGGYQTSMIGKWHLGHGGNSDPTGFDYWCVLPGQGLYHNPTFYDMGKEITVKGYATDIITDMSLDWLEKRDKDRPFFLMCHHKAPHRPWEPSEKHKDLYEDINIPEPDTLFDTYETRSDAARLAEMRISRHLRKKDVKQDPPDHLEGNDLTRWYYQRYIKDYLRCIASIDDNVGRLLDYLDEQGIADNTLVIYTSDQGFFLGEHGWYDKRFMYEESLRMPFLVRYPKEIKAGTINKDMIVNTDFAPTFLDYAGLTIPADMQGCSLRPVFQGRLVEGWRQSMYYRYWMDRDDHCVAAHYGIRTHQYKLICYYAPGRFYNGKYPEGTERTEWPQWELYDLQKDQYELNNVYGDPDYASTLAELKTALHQLQMELKDTIQTSES
ncbi:MAG: sulfatase [Ruminococcaceae bacterium]|nr:sulfatase [Oscillospiraceae bacterium]